MHRMLSDEERQIIFKLVGSQFSEMATLTAQLDSCRVCEISDGAILDFEIHTDKFFTTIATVLGEGSIEDVDKVPIILTLLQRDGRLWRLDITRADSGRPKTPINSSQLKAFGHKQGLALG